MSILVDEKTRLVVQGITGEEGTFHALQCKAYGTNVVAGVTPGKGGKKIDGISVFNTVSEAVLKKQPNASLIFVPSAYAADAIYESADAGIPLIVCVTEGIPQKDMMEVSAYLAMKGVTLIGPNCPGVISPGKCKVGIMPSHIHTPGRIGVVSRSGTLTYEAVHQLTKIDFGQSTCIGIGGDAVGGLTFTDILKLFAEDSETDAVVLIGEIGGTAEEDAAKYITESKYPKPVVAYVAGMTAPPGRRMGHAGAIIMGGKGTAQAKIDALSEAGVNVVKNPSVIGETMLDVLFRQRRIRPTANKKINPPKQK